jgi:hypothetical protein
MLHIRKLRATALSASIVLSFAAVAGPQDVANAMKVLDDVSKVTATMAQMNMVLVPPTPIADNSGAFLSPYRCDGTPTEWSEKAMSAAAGGAAGGMVGDKAAGALAGKVPFVGGLFGKKVKEKAQSTGAVMAAGGWDSIKASSDMSFASLDDMAVYLHAKHSAETDYAQRVAAAFSIYPEFQNVYKNAIENASKNAVPAPAPSTATTPATMAAGDAPAMTGCK